MRILLLSLLFLPVAFGKAVDLSEFNEKLHQNMDTVLEQNPQVYEKKSFSRAPASISSETPENLTEKLDSFDEQIDGQKSW